MEFVSGDDFRKTGSLRRTRPFSGIIRAVICGGLILCAFAASVIGQQQFEGDRIAEVALVLDGSTAQNGEAQLYLRTVREVLGTTYSTPRIRDSIERLFDTGDVANVSVQAEPRGDDAVALTFHVQRKTKAGRVSVEVDGTFEDRSVTEQALRFRLNLLDPGASVSDASLAANADLILEYLRERGYFRARVDFERRPGAASNEVNVVFRVIPGEPARISSVDVTVEGFNTADAVDSFQLKPGEVFTREKLNSDVQRLRASLVSKGFLAPILDSPRPVYDSETNSVSIAMTGRSGPRVEIIVESEEGELGRSTRNRLLPVAREGTLDFAAIIEGERRLENYYQEKGYFFADVTAACAVAPLPPPGQSPPTIDGTEGMCSSLSSADFTDRMAVVKYVVKLDRRLKLTEIRLQGTDLFTIEEIRPVLDSQTANLLGIIPLFGYGRGYTSERILDQDTATIRSLLRELGYRDAVVRVNRGVSPDGENLIITFVVEEGPPTVVSGVEIVGNTAFSTDTLRTLLPPLEGQNFSRAKARNGQRRLAEHYSNAGYYYARVEVSYDEVVQLPDVPGREFRIIYTIRNEGGPVYIERVLVTGNVKTQESAILRAITLRPGTLLKASNVYTSEQNLYATDVFSLVEIRPRIVDERPDGSRLVDVIVGVTEQPARIHTYGGGVSTDVGASGFNDFRHLNLFGRLWQGGVRVSVSQKQQLLQLDFVNPRFLNEGNGRFAPLTFSVQYLRDTTVTRFFRSAFDQGTFGIVQRVDDDGNPIDEFGAPAGDPTLNRLSFFAETNRRLREKDRSFLFVRYRFEDVRLYNISSLLIKDLLIPDSRIRISGFGATFVRDTRENCSSRYTILDIIERGEAREPCRYNATDPTRGDYLTAEYNLSVPALGANIGFNKFQASYNFYRTFPRLGNTTFAARGILGLANVFKEEPRFGPPDYPGLENILPISERFFAGGSNTLRGFEFESAGPRVVVTPEGEFRDSDGNPITLDPFTVPFGGNALAVVNLEARIPLSRNFRLVPFYDGGNVFRKVEDLFNGQDIPESDVFRFNLNAKWTHTIGLGLRVKTPIGGEFAVDYGYLLNPPTFIIPQTMGPSFNQTLPPSKLHFRFSQAF